MGGSSSHTFCNGVIPSQTDRFPGSVGSDLGAEAAEVLHAVSTIVTTAAGEIPVVGSLVGAVISIITMTSLGSLNDALLQAKINSAIFKSDLISYNAELDTIQNSFERLRRPEITKEKMQIDLIYGLRRSEYLLALFQDPKHMFWQYPLVSMRFLIGLTNILYGAIQLSSTIDPTLKVHNDATLAKFPIIIESYYHRFMSARFKYIGWKTCSGRCTIYDRPWEGTEGKWLDGLRLSMSNECYINDMEYGTLFKYSGESEYRNTLIKYYNNYFERVFPVDFELCNLNTGSCNSYQKNRGSLNPRVHGYYSYMGGG